MVLATFILFYFTLDVDCQACTLNKEDAMDHNRWMKLITEKFTSK